MSVSSGRNCARCDKSIPVGEVHAIKDKAYCAECFPVVQVQRDVADKTNDPAPDYFALQVGASTLFIIGIFAIFLSAVLFIAAFDHQSFVDRFLYSLSVAIAGILNIALAAFLDAARDTARNVWHIRKLLREKS